MPQGEKPEQRADQANQLKAIRQFDEDADAGEASLLNELANRILKGEQLTADGVTGLLAPAIADPQEQDPAQHTFADTEAFPTAPEPAPALSVPVPSTVDGEARAKHDHEMGAQRHPTTCRRGRPTQPLAAPRRTHIRSRGLMEYELIAYFEADQPLPLRGQETPPWEYTTVEAALVQAAALPANFDCFSGLIIEHPLIHIHGRRALLRQHISAYP